MSRAKKPVKRSTGAVCHARTMLSRAPKLASSTILVVARPKSLARAPGWWNDDNAWVTARAGKQNGFIDVIGWTSGIDFSEAIDGRYVEDIVGGWESAYGKGWIIRVLSIKDWTPGRP